MKPKRRAGSVRCHTALPRAKRNISIRRLSASVLRRHFRQTTIAAAVLRRRPDASALHDFRVALRRFRAALRVFAAAGEASWPDPRPPADLRRLLSAARDESVWVNQVERWCDKNARRSPRDREYVRRLRLSLRRRQKALRRRLARGGLLPTLTAMKRLTSRFAGSLDGDAREFALRQLHKALRRLLRQCVDLHRPEEWHALRRRVRRVRYLVESLSPVLPVTVTDGTVKALRRASGALGTAHDMDVAAGRLRRRPAAPRWLRRQVRRTREEAMRRFRKCWKRLRRISALRRDGRDTVAQ